MRDPVLVHVAVDLRRDDERDVRVAEVAEGPLQEALAGHVVGIHLGDDVVSGLVLGPPGVVVAGLGLRPERAGGLVVFGPALAGEVVYAEPLGHRPDLRVVALVEDPDVDVALVAQLLHRPQRALGDVERFLGRHDRGEHGDVQPRRGLDRHRILGEEAVDPDRDVLREPDALGQHDDAEADAGQVEAPSAAQAERRGQRDVRGQQQPADEQAGRAGVEEHEQREGDQLAGAGQPAVLDAHVLAGGPGERAGDLDAAAVGLGDRGVPRLNPLGPFRTSPRGEPAGVAVRARMTVNQANQWQIGHSSIVHI